MVEPAGARRGCTLLSPRKLCYALPVRLAPVLLGTLAVATGCLTTADGPHSSPASSPPPSLPGSSATSGATAPRSSAPAAPTALADEIAPEAPPAASPPDAAPPASDSRPRLTSQGYVTWIWAAPRIKEGTFLGYVRAGSSVALRSTERVRGPGCPGGFLPVEPRGYVCGDATVTLEPSERFVVASDATRAAPGPFPYRYAMSNGAPMYNRVPTAAEQARKERPLGKAGKFLRLPKTLSAHEDLAVVEPIAASDAAPGFAAEGKMLEPSRFGLVRQHIPLGSMLSFTRAFEAEGRTWLLSPDLTVVPADRVRPFRPSAFHGVRLGAGVALPIAWMRARARPRWLRAADGAMTASGASWPARSFVRLTGKIEEADGRRFLETEDRDPAGAALWVAETDATVVERRDKMPFGVGEQQKWVHVRLTQGTLVAYEGNKPVYATLISPGAGGVPVPGKDPVKMSTTPLGTYYVTFKDRATTMSPEKGDNRTFWIADVPHTQYFDPPFALHAAYWHERFGEPTSAGCVNLSPIDAEILFAWSDPPVPPDWQGATGAGAKENGPTTAVVVSR